MAAYASFRHRCVAVLVVVVASLASVASPCGPGYGPSIDGVREVGRTGEATIGAIAYPPPDISVDAAEGENYVGIYESHDGGWTWGVRPMYYWRSWPQANWLAVERVRQQDGAHFSWDHARVYRSIPNSGTSEAVYYYGHLRSAGNRWAQAVDYAHLGHLRVTTQANDIFVDNNSGNVIVTMGLQGIVVIQPDGTATPVRVGEFGPTDFSFLGKARILASSYGATFIPQLVTLFLLALSCSAIAVIGPSANAGVLRLGTVDIVGVQPPLLAAAAIAAIAAVVFGVYPMPNQWPDQSVTSAGEYAFIVVLNILIAGSGLVPLMLVAVGLADSRAGPKKLALVFLVTLGMMVFPTVLGAPLLFYTGAPASSLLPLGLILVVTLGVWLYRSRSLPPSTDTR